MVPMGYANDAARDSEEGVGIKHDKAAGYQDRWDQVNKRN